MFPYTYFFHINDDKTNQTIYSDDCVVHDENTFISSCIFTFSFYYVLPLIIIFLCYLRVFIYVHRRGYRFVNRLVSTSPNRSYLCMIIFFFVLLFAIFSQAYHVNPSN